MSGAIRQVMIRGRVQGVGYRAWVEHQARVHRLEGWVRNRSDGSVEALFGGTRRMSYPTWWRYAGAGRYRRASTAVAEQPANSDALNLRRAGERFSVLPTI